MNTIKRTILTALGIAAFLAPAWGAQTQITATLQPRSIGLGEAAQLAVTVNGSQSAQPRVPDVDGLEIVPVGQQSSMQMINGVVTSNVTNIYQVTANRAGSFTIPAITAPGVGSTQPIAFRVNQGAGGQSQPAPMRGRAQLPAPGVSGIDAAPVDAKNEPAFLRVVLPKRELTVGELVPVEVKAYFRADVSAALNGLPALSSDAFALNKLGDNPEQTRESIDGVPYTVVTWTSALSAVKAGEYPLNLDLPVLVRVQERPRRRAGARNPFKDLFGDDSPFGGSMFDDSFFDDFFGGLTEKPLTLHTDGATVKINALPAAGRPAGFSGAVGDFDVTSEAASRSGTTGDPMKLKITVTGRGNFSRVSTDGLAGSSDWKSYKPGVQFEPADSGDTTGTKTFEQSIVPMKAGEQKIPAVSFSYFDPDKETYVTKTTEPIPVEIAQNTATPPAAMPVAAAPAADKPEIAADGLAADQVVPPRANSSLQPLVRRPWFIVVNAAMLAALGIGAAVRSIRARRASDPDRLRREAAERAVSESVAAMDAALAAKDAANFFEAARHALQERLAARWHVPASQVTIPEIRTRLNGDGEAVAAVFKTADEIAYSGRRFTAPDLKQWRELVKNELHQLARI